MPRLCTVMVVLLALAACAEDPARRSAESSPQNTLWVTSTAYNSTVAQTDGRPAEAAWGERLYPGAQVIAVSRDLEARGLTEGTAVNIDGLDGVWIVADRMAARHEKTIDIYMGKDVKAAREWGRRKVLIRWMPSES